MKERITCLMRSLNFNLGRVLLGADESSDWDVDVSAADKAVDGRNPRILIYTRHVCMCIYICVDVSCKYVKRHRESEHDAFICVS